MSEYATKSPTLAAELFGTSVGFRFYATLRRICGALLVSAALLLVVRRLGGAFVRPPSFGTALIAVAAATLIAAVYRATLRRTGPAIFGRSGCDTALPMHLQRLLIVEELVVWYVPTAALLAIAASLSLPGIGTAALGAIWLTVVAGEAVWFGSRFAQDVEPPPASIREFKLEPDATVAAVEPNCANSHAADADENDAENVSQSWTRSRDPEGRDVVEGFVRVTFAAGSKQAAIHLSFCPPLERTPTLDAEPVDEIDLTLTTAVVLPYAARIDLRLAEPAEEEFQLKVAIRATADSSPESASGDERVEL
jgi:hypothetical protein